MMSQSKQWVFGIKPSGLILIVVLLSLSGIAGWLLKERHPTAILFEPHIESIQSAPLCPWREPTEDLKAFFPAATRYEAETRILSGLRIQLTQLLGRAPTGDENALHIYRIYDQQTPLGMVSAQRVKGAYGAIELVLGVDLTGKVCGAHLQRNREPESVATELQRPKWLGTFIGKTANDRWKLGEDISAPSEEARPSAEAIVQGARSLLILLEVANDPHSRNLIAQPHH